MPLPHLYILLNLSTIGQGVPLTSHDTFPEHAIFFQPPTMGRRPSLCYDLRDCICYAERGMYCCGAIEGNKLWLQYCLMS
ncbi:hypothetical protein OH76DRAFT_1397938 [Lentinus brumalis]|uniref:Secreted protein n=1 Tax=Lentinus brumalis TaxID=2498619 RepID=A0A371DPX5_9APHY|nr:hypothetical protein OH76DRAFT_1397938 [Polyporus brumalis]